MGGRIGRARQFGGHRRLDAMAMDPLATATAAARAHRVAGGATPASGGASGASGAAGTTSVGSADEQRKRRSRAARGAGPMRITWRDGSLDRFGMPVPRPLAQGPRESRTQAAEAARHLRRFDAMLRERWDRAGWDDKGGDLTVVVNAKGMRGNAWFWHDDMTGRGELGIGVSDARIGFQQSPAHSPSILLHELAHGIVGSELRGLGPQLTPYLRQREHRAVNESIADVLSTGLLGTNWRNGHEIRDGSPLRDLAKPSVQRWSESVRKDTGLEEHTIAGIMSRAAVLAAETAGTGPVVDAWYAAIDRYYREELAAVAEPGLGRAMGAWVRATMRGARLVGATHPKLEAAVRAAWDEVGLGRHASDSQLKAAALVRSEQSASTSTRGTARRRSGATE